MRRASASGIVGCKAARDVKAIHTAAPCVLCPPSKRPHRSRNRRCARIVPPAALERLMMGEDPGTRWSGHGSRTAPLARTCKQRLPQRIATDPPLQGTHTHTHRSPPETRRKALVGSSRGNAHTRARISTDRVRAPGICQRLQWRPRPALALAGRHKRPLPGRCEGPQRSLAHTPLCLWADNKERSLWQQGEPRPSLAARPKGCPDLTGNT